MILEIRNKIKDAFSPLTFDEKKHLYFWHGEPVSKSVSAKVAEYYDEPDFDKIVFASAKKQNIPVGQLKAQWKKTTEDACRLGTNTHTFVENFSGVETISNKQEEAAVKFLISLKDDFRIIGKEIRMYSQKYKFAGTADLLLRHIPSGFNIIADYKTNKDLFKAYGNLKSPFQYLESSPFNKYVIQLNLYQLMLEEIGIPIHGRLLVHLQSDGNFKRYKLENYVEELKIVMDAA